MELATVPAQEVAVPGGRLGQRLFALYRRHERIAPAVFFFAGIGWDAATVFRIDALVDNVLVALYLAALGVVVTASALDRAGQLRSRLLARWRPWFPAAMQFFLGALFSVFVFFYSQSASLSQTSVYLGLLVALLVANEFLHRRMLDLHLGLGLYYVALASFLVYFLPVVTGRMGTAMFVVGTLAAAGTVLAIVSLLRRRGVFTSARQVASVTALVVVLFGFHQAAYHLNWIPPVPIALRDAGIYREVVREGDTYRMRFAPQPWWMFWRRDERDLAWRPGESVYCFTAVFAPTRLQSRIVHVWERLDEASGEWAESDRIGYDIVGGRDYGYRGYTLKRTMRPGRWRVRVETSGGRLLSRIPFTVREAEPADTAWAWITAR
jgi:hypothetical protein